MDLLPSGLQDVSQGNESVCALESPATRLSIPDSTSGNSSDYESAGSTKYSSTDSLKDISNQQHGNQTLLGNAFKAMKNLFSPTKGKPMRSSTPNSVDVNHPAEIQTPPQQTSSPAKFTEKIHSPDDLCLRLEALALSDQTPATHNTTQDSFTTTVSRLDDSFQSTVTHWEANQSSSADSSQMDATYIRKDNEDYNKTILLSQELNPEQTVLIENDNGMESPELIYIGSSAVKKPVCHVSKVEVIDISSPSPLHEEEDEPAFTKAADLNNLNRRSFENVTSSSTPIVRDLETQCLEMVQSVEGSLTQTTCEVSDLSPLQLAPQVLSEQLFIEMNPLSTQTNEAQPIETRPVSPSRIKSEGLHFNQSVEMKPVSIKLATPEVLIMGQQKETKPVQPTKTTHVFDLEQSEMKPVQPTETTHVFDMEQPEMKPVSPTQTALNVFDLEQPEMKPVSPTQAALNVFDLEQTDMKPVSPTQTALNVFDLEQPEMKPVSPTQTALNVFDLEQPEMKPVSPTQAALNVFDLEQPEMKPVSPTQAALNVFDLEQPDMKPVSPTQTALNVFDLEQPEMKPVSPTLNTPEFVYLEENNLSVILEIDESVGTQTPIQQFTADESPAMITEPLQSSESVDYPVDSPVDLAEPVDASAINIESVGTLLMSPPSPSLPFLEQVMPSIAPASLESAEPVVCSIAPASLESAEPVVCSIAPASLESAEPVVPSIAPTSLESVESVVPSIAPAFLESAEPVVCSIAPASLESAEPVVPSIAPTSLESVESVVLSIAPASLESADPVVPSIAPTSLDSTKPVVPSIAPTSLETVESVVPSIAPTSLETVESVVPSIALTSLDSTKPVVPSIAPTSLETVESVVPSIALTSLDSTKPVVPTIAPTSLKTVELVVPSIALTSLDSTKPVVCSIAPASLESVESVMPSIAPASLESAEPVVCSIAPTSLESAEPVVPSIAPASLESADPVVPSIAPTSLESAESVVLSIAPASLESAEPVVCSIAPASLESADLVVPSIAPTSLESADPVVPSIAPTSLESAESVVLSIAPASLESAESVVPSIAPASLESADPVVPSIAPASLESADPVVPSIAPASLESADSVVLSIAPASLETAESVVPSIALTSLDFTKPVVPSIAPASLESVEPVVLPIAPESLESVQSVVPLIAPTSLESVELVLTSPPAGLVDSVTPSHNSLSFVDPVLTLRGGSPEFADLISTNAVSVTSTSKLLDHVVYGASFPPDVALNSSVYYRTLPGTLVEQIMGADKTYEAEEAVGSSTSEPIHVQLSRPRVSKKQNECFGTPLGTSSPVIPPTTKLEAIRAFDSPLSDIAVADFFNSSPALQDHNATYDVCEVVTDSCKHETSNKLNVTLEEKGRHNKHHKKSRRSSGTELKPSSVMEATYNIADDRSLDAAQDRTLFCGDSLLISDVVTGPDEQSTPTGNILASTATRSDSMTSRISLANTLGDIQNNLDSIGANMDCGRVLREKELNVSIRNNLNKESSPTKSFFPDKENTILLTCEARKSSLGRLGGKKTIEVEPKDRDKTIFVEETGSAGFEIADTELEQLIQDKFTPADIDRICTMVVDSADMDLGSHIMRASRQFDKHIGDLTEPNPPLLTSDLSNQCLDFLESIAGASGKTDYSRESLYVKFDPLVNAPGESMCLIDLEHKAVCNVNVVAPLNPCVEAASPHQVNVVPPMNSSVESTKSPNPNTTQRNLNQEIARLTEIYLMREKQNQERYGMYENQIAKLMGQSCVLEDKLIESADREKSLAKKLQEQNTAIEQLGVIMCEYEITISRLTSELIKVRKESEMSMKTVREERDSYYTHLQNIEAAFTDVHSKYEKNKKIIEIYKKNELELKKCVSGQEAALAEYKRKMEMIQETAASEVSRTCQQLEDMKMSHEMETSRVRAQLRKTELQLQSVQTTLDQKISENEQLAVICDDLICGKK